MDPTITEKLLGSLALSLIGLSDTRKSMFKLHNKLGDINTE